MVENFRFEIWHADAAHQANKYLILKAELVSIDFQINFN